MVLICSICTRRIDRPAPLYKPELSEDDLYELVTSNTCGHIFHKQCLMMTHKGAGKGLLCAVCKKRIPPAALFKVYLSANDATATSSVNRSAELAKTNEELRKQVINLKAKVTSTIKELRSFQKQVGELDEDLQISKQYGEDLENTIAGLRTRLRGVKEYNKYLERRYKCMKWQRDRVLALRRKQGSSTGRNNIGGTVLIKMEPMSPEPAVETQATECTMAK